MEVLLDNGGDHRYREWMVKTPAEGEDASAHKTPVNSPLHWAAFKVWRLGGMFFAILRDFHAA